MAAPTDSYATTFNALTESYVPKVLVDNTFIGTPVLNKLRQHTLEIPGKNWEPLVEYDSAAGEWYTKGTISGAAPGTASAEIATRAQFALQFYRKPVLLDATETDLQGGGTLIDMMKAYVKNATKRMATDLSVKAFYGDTGLAVPTLNSLANACDDADWPATGWGELDIATFPHWKAHVMEATATSTVVVSPSLENISKMIRSIIGTTGERPDLDVVEDAYWDVLASQITRNEYLMALQANAGNDVVKWGFSTLFVNEVPIVADRDCRGWGISPLLLVAPGAWGAGNAYEVGDEVLSTQEYVCILAHGAINEDPVGGAYPEKWLLQDTNRKKLLGHEALFLNWDHLKLAYNGKRSWKWDPDGWRRPTQYDEYLNFIYAWVTIGGDARRTLGRMFNVDITQVPADWTPGVVSLP